MDITASILAFLCALYARVLGSTNVQPDDDFFADLNGDSLAAAELLVRLEDVFGISLLEAFLYDSSATSMVLAIEQHLRCGSAWADLSVEDDALKDDLARLRQSLLSSSSSAPMIS